MPTIKQLPQVTSLANLDRIIAEDNSEGRTVHITYEDLTSDLMLQSTADARYLLESNNLSDIGDTSIARSNIGLGNVLNKAQIAKDGSEALTGNLDANGNAVNDAVFVVEDEGTSNYTLVAADNGKLKRGSNATWTVPDATFPVGASITIKQNGPGQITFSAGPNQTIENRQGHTKTAGDGAVVSLTQDEADNWVLTGDTA